VQLQSFGRTLNHEAVAYISGGSTGGRYTVVVGSEDGNSSGAYQLMVKNVFSQPGGSNGLSGAGATRQGAASPALFASLSASPAPTTLSASDSTRGLAPSRLTANGPVGIRDTHIGAPLIAPTTNNGPTSIVPQVADNMADWSLVQGLRGLLKRKPTLFMA
jgi:hypothetical protein